MDKFVTRTPRIRDQIDHQERSSKKQQVGIDLESLPVDPGLRPKISSYHPNDRDRIRRAYILRKPVQPLEHEFPSRLIKDQYRKFNKEYFHNEMFKDWLEYSISKDAIYCLFCYLFKHDGVGDDAFVVGGFRNWKKPERLKTHVGSICSAHNQAKKKCEALMNEEGQLDSIYAKHTGQSDGEYKRRLSTSIRIIRYLLRQGLSFRGHDESEESNNRGNYIEFWRSLTCLHEDFQKLWDSAPRNNKLTSPDIQKQIVSCCAIETTKHIIEEIGDSFFALLVDESRDVSMKEQMSIVLRFVNKRGQVIERFLGIFHVKDTSAVTLKNQVDYFFGKHGLSISKVRGQGYDGASNMSGQFNGLQALILQENESAHYVHCFAHQLQLALIDVAKNENQIDDLFTLVTNVINVVGSSCKRRDKLRERQAEEVLQALQKGDIFKGKGLHQGTELKRAGDTRWSSHYGSLISMIIMFRSILCVLEDIREDGVKSEQRIEASSLSNILNSFDFIISLHMMRNVLAVTHTLSQTLQLKEQNIVNAMELVAQAKRRLQKMRDDGWNDLLKEVSTFCMKHEIVVSDMNELFVAKGRPRRNVTEATNLHHYRTELFYVVIDLQLQHLNNRFTEVNTELLLCMSCLNPADSFFAYDRQKLLRLAEFYPQDFSTFDKEVLRDELDTYIDDMRTSKNFCEIQDLSMLAQKLIENKRDNSYPLVNLLIKLALTLPVATASVERSFSAMDIVKSRLRNRMSDDWMNDNLVTYIEKDILDSIDNDVIMDRFQKMYPRRGKI